MRGAPYETSRLYVQDPHGICQKKHAICRSQSCFSLPSVFALASNEHISKVAKRLVHFTHKPKIEQQLIWAGHLAEVGGSGFWRAFSQQGGESNFFPQNNMLWTNSLKQSSKNFSCCGCSRKRYSLEKRYFRLKGEIAFSGQVFYTDVKQRFWAFQQCLDLVSYCKIKDRICGKHIPSSKKRNFPSVGQVF